MFCLAVIVMSSSNFTLDVDRQIACCWNLIASHLVRTQCKAKAKMPTLFKPSRLWDCVPSIHLSSGGRDMSDFTEHLIYLQLQQPVWPMDLVYLVLTFILFYFSYFLCLSVPVWKLRSLSSTYLLKEHVYPFSLAAHCRTWMLTFICTKINSRDGENFNYSHRPVNPTSNDKC